MKTRICRTLRWFGIRYGFDAIASVFAAILGSVVGAILGMVIVLMVPVHYPASAFVIIPFTLLGWYLGVSSVEPKQKS